MHLLEYTLPCFTLSSSKKAGVTWDIYHVDNIMGRECLIWVDWYNGLTLILIEEITPLIEI